MKTKHIQGEWQTGDANPKNNLAPHFIIINGYIIHPFERALENEVFPKEEIEATVKLMASAPDLLEALQEMVNACLSESPEMDKVKALRVAKSAIQKATE